MEIFASTNNIDSLFKYALVATTAVVLVFTIRAWLRGVWLSFIARRRARRWQHGERVAFWLLEDAGYRVLGNQVSQKFAVTCDGLRQEYTLRADYLVERRDRLYIAEVKTGASPDLGNCATRRQLLEYLIAYDVDGILLVDADAGEVHEVIFEGLCSEQATAAAAPKEIAPLPWYVVAAGAAACASCFACL